MLELARHHVPRDDLLARLADAAVVIIEAPSGFGKSTLAAELAAGSARVVEVPLTAAAGGRRALAVPLRRALRRAGEESAASALAEPGADLAEALAAMADALHDAAPLTLVVDDAHHLDGDAALLTHLAAIRPPPLRLIVGARALPAGAAALRNRPDVRHVDAAALRFDVPQTAHLLRRGFGVAADDRTVAELHAATDGWPAALTFVAAQLQRSPATSVAGVGPAGFARLVVDTLPARLRFAAAQLAHLPWLDAELADAATGGHEVLRALLDAGIPLVGDSDGRVRLPGAVADTLTRGGVLDAEVAWAAAAHLLGRGEPYEALSLLRQAGDWERLAATITALPRPARVHLSADELIALIDALPAEAVARHPGALIELARALSRAGVPERQQDALTRAARFTDTQPPAFARALEVQQLSGALFTADRAEVTRRVAALLEAADASDTSVATDSRTDTDIGVATDTSEVAVAGEEPTIARALQLRGVLESWRGERDTARRSLRRSAGLFVDLGEPFEAARVLTQLGFNVDLHDDLATAETTFSEAVTLAGDDARARATALTYRGETRAWLGRPTEAADDLDAALRLARAVRDERAQGYAAWGMALQASLQLDAERTVAWVRAAEQHLKAWADTAVGATFVATMADLLDRAGADEEAAAMLAAAQERRGEQPELVALAEFVVAARRGDAMTVEERWPAIIADDGLEPFERARCRFLRAYAAFHSGRPDAARLHREALAEAEAIGFAALPAVLEPAAAAAINAMPDEPGAPWEVRCFGPLTVVRTRPDGVAEPVELPAGLPAVMVAALAVNEAPVRVARMIDLLWPGVGEADARARFRQVLYRLRRSVPGLVVRLGNDRLAFGDGVVVELAEVERLGERVTGRSDDARHAAGELVDRMRGPLLADFPLDVASEELEAEVVMLRARVRGRYLAALDLLAAEADDRGDVDAATGWRARAHHADPADQRRAIDVARRLTAVGRAPAARAVLEATTAAIDRHGIPPGTELLSLMRHCEDAADGSA